MSRNEEGDVNSAFRYACWQQHVRLSNLAFLTLPPLWLLPDGRASTKSTVQEWQLSKPFQALTFGHRIGEKEVFQIAVMLY